MSSPSSLKSLSFSATFLFPPVLPLPFNEFLLDAVRSRVTRLYHESTDQDTTDDGMMMTDDNSTSYPAQKRRKVEKEVASKSTAEDDAPALKIPVIAAPVQPKIK